MAMCHCLDTLVPPQKKDISRKQLQVSTFPSTQNYLNFTKNEISKSNNLIYRAAKMSFIPRDSIENSITSCFFIARQALGVQLEKQAMAQLPVNHRGIEFIQKIQPTLSHLLEVYSLIVHFVKAGNNNHPTWTPADKHWNWVLEYEQRWTDLNNYLHKSALIVSGGDMDEAEQSAKYFMDVSNVVKCDFGFTFFEALLSNDVHDDLGDFFDQIDEFCAKVEQECVQSRA